MGDYYFWTEPLRNLFQTLVFDPVMAARNIDGDGYFGLPAEIIRRDVIQLGLADFSREYTHPNCPMLPAYCRAQLYAFFNMRHHFYCCCKAIDAYWPELSPMMSGPTPPVVIDLGCGPGTAGLALVDAYPKLDWAYVGVDCALPMQELAKNFMSGLRERGVVLASSRHSFVGSWSDVRPEQLSPGAPVLVICSFFCANPTLTQPILANLAAWLSNLANHASGSLRLLYINSDKGIANSGYSHLTRLLGSSFRDLGATKDTVEYLLQDYAPTKQGNFVRNLFTSSPR